MAYRENWHLLLPMTYSTAASVRISCVKSMVYSFIEEYRFRGETTALMKLEDIDTENDARAFVNLEVYFPKSYIGNDGDGELSAPGDFFLHYSVYDTDKGYLGHIVDVDMSTTNVLFVVERENGEELLIPATDDLVVSVDEKAKKIEMNIPEGLLDL